MDIAEYRRKEAVLLKLDYVILLLNDLRLAVENDALQNPAWLNGIRGSLGVLEQEALYGSRGIDQNKLKQVKAKQNDDNSQS